VHDAVRGVMTIQRNVSTLSTDKRAAQKIANDRREADWQKFWEGANGKAKPTRLRDTTPTCGQIVDIYLEKSASPYAKAVADVFLRVVAEGVGRWTENYERAREVRLSALNRKAMIAFRDQEARQAAGLPITLNNVSINTYMRQAKMLFARRAIEHYLALNLPMANIRDWAEAATLNEDHYEQGYVAFSAEEMRVADQASEQLLELAKLLEASGDMTHARRNKNAYAAYWIMRSTGLRNIEIEHMRWEWIRPRADGHYQIDVIKRAYWRGPKKSSGSVPMARELYALLVELFGPPVPGPDGFVLCGTLTDRKEATHRVVQAFVRRYLKRGSKNFYCLRKQFATAMEDRYDLKTASAALRHGEGDTATAKNHYVDGQVKLSRVQPLWTKEASH
jgi:hypothetical protein